MPTQRDQTIQSNSGDPTNPSNSADPTNPSHRGDPTKSAFASLSIPSNHLFHTKLSNFMNSEQITVSNLKKTTTNTYKEVKQRDLRDDSFFSIDGRNEIDHIPFDRMYKSKLSGKND